jgi:hypothetical protein
MQRIEQSTAQMDNRLTALRLKVDYYRALIANDSLFDRAIGFYLGGQRCYDRNHADDLAIPVGGKRRGGFLEMTGEKEFPVQSARRIVELLKRWPGDFPNVRLDRFDCYVEWGEPIPGLVQDADERIVIARGRHFGYSDEATFQFIELVRSHKGTVPHEAILNHSVLLHGKRGFCGRKTNARRADSSYRTR